MNAIDLIAARVHSARAEDQDVPSPCISVCRMSTVSGWCEGCFRTLDEIRLWSRMTDADKRVVWALIEQRTAAAPTSAPV